MLLPVAGCGKSALPTLRRCGLLPDFTLFESDLLRVTDDYTIACICLPEEETERNHKNVT
jgi:hypothetical protein